MRILFSLILLLLLFLLQVSLLPLVLPADLVPNLVLIWVCLNFFLSRTRSSLILGFLGGLLLDLSQPGFFGLSGLIMVFYLGLVLVFAGSAGRSLSQGILLSGLASLVLRFSASFPSVEMVPLGLGVLVDTGAVLLLLPLLLKVSRWFGVDLARVVVFK